MMEEVGWVMSLVVIVMMVAIIELWFGDDE